MRHRLCIDHALMRPGKDMGWLAFFKALFKEWSEDDLGDSAAALTYYAMLSLFPFLLFVMGVAGLLLNPDAVANLIDQIAAVMPPQVTSILGNQLKALEQGHKTGLLTFGIIGALWAASGAVSSLMKTLNRCYDVRETRPLWKRRGIAILATIVAGVLSVLAAVIMFVVPALGAWVGGPVGKLITWGRFIVGGFVVILLWALLYRFLPNVKPRFQLITPGSVVGIIVWLLASWGFTEYVRHFGRYEAIYGALGGVIVLLVWMWLSSLVVLLGAEINKLITGKEKLQRETDTGELSTGRGPEPQPT